MKTDIAEAQAKQAQRKADLGEKRSQLAAGAAQDAPGLVIAVTSHDEGRNATVALYEDRIERVQKRSHNSWSKANQDAEVTPLKAVSSVQAKKDGFRTRITIYATGNTIEFRTSHDEAARFKGAVTERLLRSPAGTPASSVVDELGKLADLRDRGVVTQIEFEEQKARLLGTT